MGYKDKNKQKEYQRLWTNAKNEKRKPNTSHIRQRNAEFVNNIKESNPCTDCGQFYPSYVMQFDHTGQIKKFRDVGRMASENYSIQAIQREIDKCELVCANCHAVRTYTRRVSG